jgi:hypothetical protein
MRRPKRRGGQGGDDAGQLQIDWKASEVKTAPASPAPLGLPATNPVAADRDSPPLVQHLPWDFQNSYPQPIDEAIDTGIVSDEDLTPENIRAMHDEHARQLLAALRDLDAVLDARRLGVHPGNRKKPMLAGAKEQLRKFFETEPQRLERWFQTLMDTYESAFGPDAADAFAKAIRAWHAGIEVTAEKKPMPANADARPGHREKPPSKLFQESHSPSRRKRIVARLPVPRPLPSAVTAGHFGQEENGKPVRPGTHEIREITERHAEKLIELLDSFASAPLAEKDAVQAEFTAGIAAYAEDFGESAAEQFEAFVRRQASLGPNEGWRR